MNNYSEEYYTNYDGGRGYENEEIKNFLKTTADRLYSQFSPKSHLDVGCAYGTLSKFMRKNRVDSFGVDSSEFAILKADSDFIKISSLPELKLPEEFPHEYDLLTCIEVLEHIDPQETEKATKRLCELSDAIVFSSTPNNGGDPTHINCRTKEEWVSLFEENEFESATDVDLSFISQWAMLFKRKRHI